jgi:hypothetical protein
MPSPSQPTQTEQKVTQTNLPDYAKPYFENLLGRGQGQLNQEYTPYPYERIAGFTPAQEQVQQNVLGLGAPNQFAMGSGLAAAAGQGSLLASDYAPGQFNAQQVTAGQVNAPSMRAAQTSFGSGPLEQFRMAAPERFGQAQAQEYMSPYIRNVLDVQKREAIRDAQKGQVAQDLGAARQGTYGGSRQLLAGIERERNLGQQLGDIESRGLQSAFENAQSQFERDRGAGMTAGQQNLGAALQQQQLGTQTGLQAALANLTSAQQSNVQNLAAQLQTQGLNAEQSMRAALANQQSNLEAQRLGEQSRQFGSQQGLAGLAQAGQMGQTLGNLGQYQQQADLQRLQAQAGAAGEVRALEQQYLDQMYGDFLRQRDFPMEQLGQFSSLLRGLPMQLNSTQTAYATPPSFASQALGAGLAGLGAYNTFRGG